MAHRIVEPDYCEHGKLFCETCDAEVIILKTVERGTGHDPDCHCRICANARRNMRRETRKTEPMPFALYFEIDHAAQDLARKGLTGTTGDALPMNMNTEAVRWIARNQQQFSSMIEWWKGVIR